MRLSRIVFLLFLVTFAGAFSGSAWSQESVDEEIVVTAPNPCSVATIKRGLDYTFVRSESLPKALLYEFNTFNGKAYSLSCAGEPKCRGHILSLATANVNVTPENGGATILIRGEIKQCKKDPDPKDPTCRTFQNYERQVFIPRRNVFNAHQTPVSMTCEPGQCEAILLNNHRSSAATYGNPDQDLILIRKSPGGVETVQLIVNSLSAVVFADDKSNIDRGRNELRACSSGAANESFKDRGTSRRSPGRAAR